MLSSVFMSDISIRLAATVALLILSSVFAPADEGKVTNPSSAQEQYELGRKYHRGEGVATDPDKAAHWIRLAAESGHSEAQGYYGFLLSQGIGVAKNEVEAVAWMRKAAEAGVASAQFNLGLMILKGTGTTKDSKTAVVWITRAAQAGYPEARARLAEYYYFGEGPLEKAPEKALPWARLGAESGHAWSQNLYATLLEFGIGTAVDRGEALVWYRKAAEQGSAKAQASLGRLLEGGIVVKRDVVEAYYWLWKSAEQGEANGINYLKDLVPGMTEEERRAALRRVGIEPVEEK